MIQLLSIVRHLPILMSVGFACYLGGAASLHAQSVTSRLSTKQTYVGLPIVLQISINDAGEYEPPTIPQIDGLDIERAGSPSSSSRITIINGRRSETRSVVLRYRVTPQREGTFEIPPLTVQVDGQPQSTRPHRFVASQSETGDLLFVEIEGAQDRVYVGQPLDLTLKIWIKPFADRANGIQLSEANMWQLISDHSSWGSFADRLQELAQNNQRPAGREVLRDNGSGEQASYYLYEIKARVYPKQAGRIQGDDVRIVVDYPTQVGESRDPFDEMRERMFSRDPFGSSLLDQMFDDDFFSSPFGGRLRIESVRPVVAQAQVDSTEVLPVPQTGRPSDYRGAVGNYQIFTEASPTSVAAGDPITLNIRIRGDGPMELVQAPPLHELPELTADFKVVDQKLAGFVEGDTKFFSTTIRPQREGISQIPAIPFSFFDPVIEQFRTVESPAIPVTVTKADTLELDQIVSDRPESGSPGDSGQQARNDSPPSKPRSHSTRPDLTNEFSASVLEPAPATWHRFGWLPFVLVPPVIWLLVVATEKRQALSGRVANLRSPQTRALATIRQANSWEQLTTAFTAYMATRTRSNCPTIAAALGTIRAQGWYQIAGEIEAFCDRLAKRIEMGQQSIEPADREKASQLLQQLHKQWSSRQRARILPSKTTQRSTSDKNPTQTMLLLGLSGTIMISLMSCNTTLAKDELPRAEGIQLTIDQQKTILNEANAAYAAAQNLTGSDPDKAQTQFEIALQKYQTLADAGIRNAKLYLNLGNTHLQLGNLARAIASYEQARLWDPGNRQISRNLRWARFRLAEQPPTPQPELTATGIKQRFGNFNRWLVEVIGYRVMAVLVAINSLLFWGILIAQVARKLRRAGRWAAAPGTLMTLALVAMLLYATDNADGFGIIVDSPVALRSGDGEQFDPLIELQGYAGRRVEWLQSRGEWSLIQLDDGRRGWINHQHLERITP